ncbi:MAG: hypothetical protein ACI4J4_05670 [Ruminiclostridium sp.]
MLLFKTRETILGNQEIVDAHYVDGGFVAFFILCLISAPIFTAFLAIMGAAEWICSHAVLCGIIVSAFIAIVTFIMSKSCHKQNMGCFTAGTAITLTVPAIGTAVVIIPEIILDNPISAICAFIMSVIIYYGGAFLTFSITKLLKNGVKCLVASVIYLIVSVLFMMIVVFSGDVINLSSIIELYAF